jgi:hypothetical protein
MNVEIGTAKFLYWEYINPNFFAVHVDDPWVWDTSVRDVFVLGS